MMARSPCSSCHRPLLRIPSSSRSGAPVEVCYAGRRAAASRGIAALSLAYFRVEGLPAELKCIPLEHIGTALRWLHLRGVSRNPEIGVSAWSHRGRDLPFTGFDTSAVEWDRTPLRVTPGFVAAPSDTDTVEAAEIPVERINGPVLLVSGTDDQAWPSSVLSEVAMCGFAPASTRSRSNISATKGLDMRLERRTRALHLARHISYIP